MRILINEFDDIRIEIERGLNALYAIDYAMENGACSADSFTEGLYFVYSGLCDQLEKLKEVGIKWKYMNVIER